MLNHTGIQLSDVASLAKHMQGLRELHLCGNGYKTIQGDVSALRKLECLRMNNNSIKRWDMANVFIKSYAFRVLLNLIFDFPDTANVFIISNISRGLILNLSFDFPDMANVFIKSNIFRGLLNLIFDFPDTANVFITKFDFLTCRIHQFFSLKVTFLDGYKL